MRMLVVRSLWDPCIYNMYQLQGEDSKRTYICSVQEADLSYFLDCSIEDVHGLAAPGESFLLELKGKVLSK